jgi:hypothetical protein
MPILPEEVRNAASRSLRLFPIKGKEKKPPLVEGWPTKATCNLDQLEAWACDFMGCNWGLATGLGSGVFVLDIDGEPGCAALLGHDRLGQKLPDTLSVSTGNGSHVYFRYPEGQAIRNSARKLAPGLDIRGEGGYVVIPPSIHPNGTQYAFDDPNEPIANAPEWLLELIVRKEARLTRPPGNEIGILAEGQRNDGLARYGGALRRRGASLQELETALLEANAKRCRPPLPDDEVLRVAASMAKYAVGGPDPLECAWAAIRERTHRSRYEQFLALARELQLARPGLSIALPLQRIGILMECDWTQARRWCQRAVRDRRLRLVERCVPHRRATLYIYVVSLNEATY